MRLSVVSYTAHGKAYKERFYETKNKSDYNKSLDLLSKALKVPDKDGIPNVSKARTYAHLGQLYLAGLENGYIVDKEKIKQGFTKSIEILSDKKYEKYNSGALLMAYDGLSKFFEHENQLDKAYENATLAFEEARKDGKNNDHIKINEYEIRYNRLNPEASLSDTTAWLYP